MNQDYSLFSTVRVRTILRRHKNTTRPQNTVITENLGENQENVPAEIVQLMTSELPLSEVTVRRRCSDLTN